jgi:hypothetical protein
MVEILGGPSESQSPVYLEKKETSLAITLQNNII